MPAEKYNSCLQRENGFFFFFFNVGVGTQSSLSPSAWEHGRENELIILREIYEF